MYLLIISKFVLKAGRALSGEPYGLGPSPGRAGHVGFLSRGPTRRQSVFCLRPRGCVTALRPVKFSEGVFADVGI